MGRAMDQVLLQEAVDLARKLWHAYIIEPSDESVQFIVDTMDPQNLSLIGTGKHELYVNLEAFFAGLERDQGLCFKKCVHSYYSLSVICRHVKLFPYDARTIPIRRSSTTTRFL